MTPEQIASRCRSSAPYALTSGNNLLGIGQDVLLQAADEIERLAAELAKCRAEKDAAYLERNKLVRLLAFCFPSGIMRTTIEGWSDDWHGCVYIDFPWGQASWHYHDSHTHLFADLPAYQGNWDGHTTEEKYSAITRHAASLARMYRGAEPAREVMPPEYVARLNVVEAKLTRRAVPLCPYNCASSGPNGECYCGCSDDIED